MSYSQQRLDSQQLFDYTKLGQKVVVNMGLGFADTKHNQFSNYSDWTQISQTLTDEMTQLVDLEKDLNNSINASVKTEQKIRQMIAESEESETNSSLDLIAVNIDEIFDENLALISAENTTKVEDNDNYKELMNTLSEFCAESADNADNESDLNDDDLQALETELKSIPIDQFSKTEIEIPVKNRKCGHVYDRQQLIRVLETQRPNQLLRCPYVGCGNRSVTLADVVADGKTKALIQKLKTNKA